MLRSILSKSLADACFLCRMSVAFGNSQELFFFLWFAILTRFVWNNDFFSKHDWFFLSLPLRSRVSLSFLATSYSCLLYLPGLWKWGWRWPCLDRNLPASLVVTMLFSRLIVAIYIKAVTVRFLSKQGHLQPHQFSINGHSTKHTSVTWSIPLKDSWL